MLISLGMRFELLQFSANSAYIFRDNSLTQNDEEGTMLLFLNLFLRYYSLHAYESADTLALNMHAN